MTEREWKFETAITQPNGVRHEVTVTVPAASVWGDMVEVAAIAQTCATELAVQVAAHAGRPPF